MFIDIFRIMCNFSPWKSKHVNLSRQAAAKGLQTGLKPKKAKAKAKSKVKQPAPKGA
jgi:hypothetical protein